MTFSLTFSLAMHAQVEINNLAMESTPFLCRPGVTNKTPSKGLAIGYTYSPEFKMRAPNAENRNEVERNERIGGKLKIPLINQPKLKFMLGFKYAYERYYFDDIDPENYPLFKRMNDVPLKKSEAAAYIVRPINHKYYTSVRLSAGYQGDYDGFVSLGERFAVYRAAGIFGVKKSDDLEYGFGVLYSKNVRRTSVYPFGFFNYTINDKWGIESAIPVKIKLRRNFNERNIATFGLEYDSQNYSIRVQEPTDGLVPALENTTYHYRRSSLQVSGSYFKQTSDWTWLEFKLGYNLNLGSQALDLPEHQTYDLNPTGSIVGSVIFFISPPRKYLESCNVRK